MIHVNQITLINVKTGEDNDSDTEMQKKISSSKVERAPSKAETCKDGNY